MQHISEPLLQAYLDGFCGEARRAEVEEHVASCEQCRERFEEAQAAAQKASKLLGTLEPGPVHAPSFEELKERALSQPAGAEKVAAALEAARAATAPPEKKKKRSSWQRSGLAWAATIVVAFGLGWLTRGGIDLPADLRAPQQQAAGPPAATPGRTASEAGGEAAESTLNTPDSAEIADALDETRDRDDRVGNLSALSADPASPPPTPAEPEVARREVTASEETPPVAEGEPVAGQRRAAAAEQRANAPVASEAQDFERNEAEPGRAGFADAVGDGFMVVDRDDAELWLGAPLRELSELALLRAEVGPGALVEGGLAGRPAVRLVYRARTGQEVALVQQYVGPLDDRQLAQVSGEMAQKTAPADAASFAERSRSLDAVGADRADRDVTAAGELDLPATLREPDGRVTYRWLQAEGYLLSVSGELEPDVLRGLADIVR